MLKSCPSEEFGSPPVLAMNWWAKAYRFANFSLGDPDLRRTFQTRIAFASLRPPSDWRLSRFPRLVPTPGQRVGTVCPHCRRYVKVLYVAPRWLGPLRPGPSCALCWDGPRPPLAGGRGLPEAPA